MCVCVSLFRHLARDFGRTSIFRRRRGGRDGRRSAGTGLILIPLFRCAPTPEIQVLVVICVRRDAITGILLQNHATITVRGGGEGSV